MSGIRTAVDSRLGRDTARPSAAPVDTFVQTNAGSGLFQLSKALGEIAPEAAGLADTLAARAAQKDEEKALADASTAHLKGKTHAQALRDGDINPAGSAHYQKFAKQQSARLAAMDYGSYLNVELETRLQDATSIDEVHQAVNDLRNEFAARNIDPNDSQFAGVFAQSAAPIEANAIQQFGYTVGKNLQRKTEQDFGQLVGKALLLEDVRSVGDAVTGGVSSSPRARMIGAMSALRENAFQMGIKGARVNELIFENVASIAVSNGRPDLIETLQRLPTGPDGTATLGSIPAYQEKLTQAWFQAQNTAANVDRRERTATKAEVTDLQRQMQNDLLNAIAEDRDPNTVDTTAYLRRLNALDPTKVPEFVSYRNQLVNGWRKQTEPAREREVAERVYDPTHPLSLAQLRDKFMDGGLSTATYSRWVDRIKSRDRVTSGAVKGTKPTVYINGALRYASDLIRSKMASRPERVAMFQAQLRQEVMEEMYAYFESPDYKPDSPAKTREHLRGIVDAHADSILPH